MPRIENAGKQAVPTIKKIAESVREALEKKKKEPVQNTFQKDA